MAFELVDQPQQAAVIKVIGVGGGGGNAVEHMVVNKVEGVDFVVANTDAQALNDLSAATKLQLGAAENKGLGAGANPEVGRAAALHDREKIQEVLKGTDMVFITAGMGGGTGTGAAPVVAEVAKEMDVLAVAVVTKPFDFENRMQVAEQGIVDLGHHVDSLIAIPNEKLLTVLGEEVSLEKAFAAANDVLLGAVQGIADIIIRPGLINVDFADVKTVMSERGLAIMGTGEGEGESRAADAADRAIHSPLLDDVDLRGARGVVVNITTAAGMGIMEYREVGQIVREFTSHDATVVLGTVVDDGMGERMRVTVVATGLGADGALARSEPPRPVLTGAQEPRPAAGPAAGPARVERAESQRGRMAARHGAASPPGETLGVAQSLRQQAAGPAEAEDEDYLDIPSFLRRQAD